MDNCNVVDLQRAGKGETYRVLRLGHFKCQPILCDEGMLVGDDLDEKVMVSNGDSRQYRLGRAGDTESFVAKERDKEETEE